jgi:short-subunit dehydrogenase
MSWSTTPGRSIRRAVTDTVDRFHDVERVTTLNYFGAIRLTLALLPGMVERRSGHVVQVTTLGTIFHVPRFSAYLGAKAALEEYSRVLASEVARDRVHVSLVHLPLVRTAMMGPSEGTFKGTPSISAEQASTLVARAIAHRRPQVSMGLRPLITTRRFVRAPRHPRGGLGPDDPAAALSSPVRSRGAARARRPRDPAAA